MRSLELDNTKKTEQIHSLKVEVNQVQLDNTQKSERISSLKADVTQMANQIRSLELDNTKKTEQISSLKVDVTQMGNQIRSLELDNTKKTKQISSLKVDVTQMSNQIRPLELDNTKKTEQIDNLLKNICSVQTDASQKTNEIDSLNAKVHQQGTAINQLGTTLSEQGLRLLRVERVASFALNRETTKLWEHTKMHYFGSAIYNDLVLTANYRAQMRRWGNNTTEFHADYSRAIRDTNSRTSFLTRQVETRIRTSRHALTNPRYQNIALATLNRSAADCRKICNSNIHTNGMPFHYQQAIEANDCMRPELTSEVHADMTAIIESLNDHIPQRPAGQPR
jgi:predicted  nucleic acid-binding Zn-ribbon protein